MSFIRIFIPVTFEIKKTMLVTTADEIRAYLPTSVYSGDDSLLALMEDTEESVLVPVLGRELYEKVCEDYEKAVEEYGGVTPQVIAKEDLTPEIRLIRHCQLPVVYLTLANSTGILSVNLNEGGGLNQSYTEMFDNADKDAVGRFERDAWFKGHRGIDRLLLFLENDARSKAPVFAELWHKSRYFYFQGDLLFTTAETMSRYLDIGGSREKFIALLPDIRYCQQSYIAPSIGEGMTETLVGWCTGNVKPQAETDEDGGEADGAKAEAAEEVWRKAVDKLRMALALFVESRRPEKQRKYSENEAMLAMATARAYIAANQDSFLPYITDSPLYVPPVEEAPEETEEEKEQREKCRFDYDDPENSIFVFRPTAFNRH